MTKPPKNTALDHWRELGRSFADDHLNMEYEEASVAATDCLRNEIVAWYSNHVKDSSLFVAPDSRISDAELARKYGVHRSQIGRWRRSSNSHPTLQSFCIVSAAENICFEDGVLRNYPCLHSCI